MSLGMWSSRRGNAQITNGTLWRAHTHTLSVAKNRCKVRTTHGRSMSQRMAGVCHKLWCMQSICQTMIKSQTFFHVIYHVRLRKLKCILFVVCSRSESFYVIVFRCKSPKAGNPLKRTFMTIPATKSAYLQQRRVHIGCVFSEILRVSRTLRGATLLDIAKCLQGTQSEGGVNFSPLHWAPI